MDEWIAEAVGKMHINRITNNELAAHLGYNPKYVSMVLNGKKTPKKAQEVFMRGIDEIIAERNKT